MVRRRLERGGVPFVVVLQPDGSFACLPAWMTEAQAPRFEISAQPDFSLDGLRALRVEVDALVSGHLRLKVLPISFPLIQRPVGIVTLKGRSLGPLAQRFIDGVREVARTIG